MEKKRKKKLDISISNHEIGLLNFLRFIAFTIFLTFKNCYETLSINSLPQNEKNHHL